MKEEPIDQLSDHDILMRIRKEEGNKYFRILYERYYPKVLNRCYSLVKNRSMAEELAEDVFARAFEKLSSFQERSSFASWLYALTYNRCIDYLRQKKKLHYPNWSAENEIPDIVDEQDEPELEINYSHLLVILEEIHPEEKAILLMKYQEQLSMKEIGNILRISEDAAKMRLKRARTRVKYLYMQKLYNISPKLPIKN